MTSKRRANQRAVIYVRISLDKVGEGLGVQRQEDECRDLCARNGWEVVEVCVDNDVSANSKKIRPAYQKALGLIESGEADIWVSWAYDRTMRKIADLDPFVEALKSAGASAHFVRSGGIDLATAGGQMMAGMLVLLARAETGMKSERQKAQNRQRANSGKRRLGGGVRIFGWQEDRLTLHPIEAPALKTAVEEVIDGRSLRSLIAEWNSRPELAPPRGGIWRYSTISALLQRPSSAGLQVYAGTVLRDVKTDWEPIISVRDYEVVTALLSRPERRTAKTNTLKHFLSGMAICGVCQGPLHIGAVNNRGVRTEIFRCKQGNSHVTRTFAPVRQAVEEAVIERLSQPDAASLFAPQPKKSTRSAIANIDRIRERMVTAESDYAAGDLNGAQLRSITAALEEELREAQSLVVSQVVVNVPESLRHVKPAQVRKAWESLTPYDQRTISSTLLTVTIYPKKDEKYGSLPYGCLMEWN